MLRRAFRPLPFLSAVDSNTSQHMSDSNVRGYCSNLRPHGAKDASTSPQQEEKEEEKTEAARLFPLHPLAGNCWLQAENSAKCHTATRSCQLPGKLLLQQGRIKQKHRCASKVSCSVHLVAATRSWQGNTRSPRASLSWTAAVLLWGVCGCN